MHDSVTIHLIRHGKTPGNLRGSFVGSIDQPVAPEGAAELEALVQQGRYPPVQAVLSSPMRRCRETAQIIYADHDRFRAGPGPSSVIEDLRERCFGEFEDKTHAEIIAIPGFEQWGWSEQSMQFPGGEEYEPFLQRVGAAFWQAAGGVSEAAIVTHGGVIMGILAQYAQPRKGYFDWACHNGGGYTLHCDTWERQIAVLKSL